MFWNQIKPALRLFLALTVLTGVIYPLLVTGLAQGLYPRRANGSLIFRHGRAVGSKLIGQPFDNPDYFWGRPSATSPVPYNANASSGSNLGPTNPALVASVQARIHTLREADPGNTRPIPVDLVTASASGLDPHISPAAAEYQIPRVAGQRGLSPETLEAIVKKHTRGRFLGLLGEPAVNVLEVNLELDGFTVQ